ncbi:MAG: lysophospholipid acyltransferase family protein [Fusobacteriaceae bacterium]
MFGLVLVFLVGLITFTYITVIHFGKLKTMEEYERIKYGRMKLKFFSKIVLKSIGVKLKVTYEDKKYFQEVLKNSKIVFISNHTSNFDIPVLMEGLETDIGFIAKQEMENWFFYGKWMKMSGSVFLNRKNSREGIKGIKKAVELVKKGHPMIIFPQGQRKDNFIENEFKKGSFKLVSDVGEVVVPLVLKGVNNIQKAKGKKIYFMKEVELVICSPIDTRKLSEEEKKNLNIIVENKIREIYNS